VNGVLIHEWGTHDRTVGTETTPAPLVAALEAQFGEHALSAASADREQHVSTCDVIHWSGYGARTNEQLRSLCNLVRESVAVKTAASEHLLASEPWDLFFTVFGETHCATHQLWHLHRPTTLRDRESRALLGDPVDETFTTVDASIARHLELAGPDATTILVLHSGMEHQGGGRQLFPAVLRRLPDAPALVPCSVPTGNGIRLLVKGRDPDGVIDPGDVEAVAARVRASFLALVDDHRAEPAVASVQWRAEVVPELADDDRLADLYVEWHEHPALDSVSSDELGSVHVERAAARTGDHTPDGLVVVHAPGVVAGTFDAIDPVAVAPMIMQRLGVPFPSSQVLTASTRPS
jgi:predicted AlkP superfamily phosphohydrolase/phosphomutase